MVPYTISIKDSTILNSANIKVNRKGWAPKHCSFLVKEKLMQMNSQSEEEMTQKLEISIPPTCEQQKPLIYGLNSKYLVNVACFIRHVLKN